MRIVLVSFCMLLASTFSASASERARALLLLIGFDVAAESQAASFAELPNQMGPSLSDGGARDWSAAGEGLFQADAMMDFAVETVDAALSPEQIADLALHYSSDEAMLITDLEKLAQDPAARFEVEAAQEAFIANLDDSFRPRFEIIAGMMDGMGVVDSGTALALNINIALMAGMAGSDAQGFSAPEREALMRMQEDMIRAEVRTSVLESMAYTYRDLSDDTLQRYSDFLQTKDARALYSAINLATESVVTKDAEVLGRRLLKMSSEREL